MNKGSGTNARYVIIKAIRKLAANRIRGQLAPRIAIIKEHAMLLKIPQRYWHTIRYLWASQLSWRVWYAVRRRLGLYRRPKLAQASALDSDGARALRFFMDQCHEHRIHGLSDMEALRRQCFCFLNHSVENLGHIPWFDASLSRLWRYHLHGFAYLRDFSINAAQDNYLGDRDRAMHWMRDWLEKNPVGADVAWDAYTSSERLINWALALAVFEIRDTDILLAYARQAHWLMRWLEYDLRANHLLKNAAALSVAAALMKDSSLAATARSLLESQLREQILEDGGHYERSPLYHSQALWDLLVVHAVSREPLPLLVMSIASMTRFLEHIQHPDGDIPLFGDAALRAAPSPGALTGLARSSLPASAFAEPDERVVHDGAALQASGFFVVGDDARQRRLLVKTAPPAPDWQPGHSHADMLSYELCVGQRRLIVDSGVHGYAESPYRDYCRGGSAHNIAQLDRLEQCELWGVFRCARRSCAMETVFERQQNGALLVCGYVHFTGYRHLRRIQYFSNRDCWEIQDRFEAAPPQAIARNYIHLHPECRTQQEAAGVEVRHGDCRFSIEPLAGETIALYEADDAEALFRYCPEFGRALPAPGIILKAAPPVAITGYRIRLLQ